MNDVLIHRMKGVAEKSAPPTKARLTVVDLTYYQTPDNQPMSHECRFSREIPTDREVIPFNMLLNEEWLALPKNKMPSKVAMLVIHNLPTQFASMPNDEQREAAEAKVVRVSYGYNTGQEWLIPHGESMRGMPSNWEDLRLKCDKGTTKVSIFAVPADW